MGDHDTFTTPILRGLTTGQPKHSNEFTKLQHLYKYLI